MYNSTLIEELYIDLYSGSEPLSLCEQTADDVQQR